MAALVCLELYISIPRHVAEEHARKRLTLGRAHHGKDVVGK